MVAGKSFENTENKKLELRMELREARYTGLHSYVAAGNLEKLKSNFLGRNCTLVL